MMGKWRASAAGMLFFALLFCGARAADEEDGEVDFESFVRYYYINPQPYKAPAAARSFLSSELAAGEETCDEDCRYSAAYAFGRIGQLEPNVVPEYHVLFEEGNHQQRIFMLDVLQLCGDKRTEEFFISRLNAGRYINEGKVIKEMLSQGMPFEFDPVDKTIESPLDVDLLWREFAITGSEEAIRHIIGVLGWFYDGDVRQKYIACTTKWTLSENSREHSQVAHICSDELARTTDSTRRVLEEIVEDLEIFETLKRLERRGKAGESGSDKIEEGIGNQAAATGSKAWALGCSAVLTERNHHRHDLLAGGEINWKNIGKTKKLIDETWGITTRDDLFSDLLWLNGGGNRERFDIMGICVVDINDGEYEELRETYSDDEEMLQEMEVARKHYGELQGRGISGWDYARFISLCRWGYMVGHLGEDEAWELIRPAARILQRRFDSWEELGRNYLVGREFWSYEETANSGYRCEDACQRLSEMRDSPWNKYPWDMDLTDTTRTNGASEAKPSKER
ncbi:MAG: DUF1266 domain-containing protein [Planctomycetota bacterium]|nr:MAG: DUF1266 domain-containing protein [Planctomycetota bacterium]